MNIVFVSPKGGVGKTTSLLTFANALFLLHPEIRVSFIDTDVHSQTLRAFFATRGQLPSDQKTVGEDRYRFNYLGGLDLPELCEVVQEKMDWGDVSLIDLHGSEGDLNRFLTLLADVVIIPSRIGQSDLVPAISYLNDVELEASRIGIELSAAFLLTFVPPARFMSEMDRILKKNIHSINIPVFDTNIQDRPVYKRAQDRGIFLMEGAGILGSEAGLSGATDESVKLYSEIIRLYGRQLPIPKKEEA